MTRVSFALFLAAVSPLLAQSSGTKLPPPPLVPELRDINVETLHDAARVSLVCGSEFLLSQIDETNGWTFCLEPYPIVVGHSERRTVERRYKSVTRTIERPIWKEKWENYQTYITVGGGSSADRKRTKRVTRRRLVSRKKTGTKKETVTSLVPDPKGSIVRKHSMPAGPIYGDLWQPGFAGQNAMVLLTLLKAGVSEYDPRVMAMSESLSRLVQEYNVPDTTWDVAWMAAAFCHLNGSQYEEPRRKTLNRLLDGQITEGKARGLWGPICINMRLLAAMIAHEMSYQKRLDELKDRQKKKPDSRARAAQVAKMKSLLEELFTLYDRITQQGNRFQDVTKRYQLDDGGGFIKETYTPGLPYFFYKRTLVDMDSTAVALYAIRQAAEKGYLPERTEHPLSAKKETLLPSEKTSAILARTAHALAQRQDKDGTWDAARIHKLCHTFDHLNVVSLEEIETFETTSPKNLLTIAQAFGALMDAGRAVGLDKLLSRFNKNVHMGKRAQLRAARDYLANKEEIVIPIMGSCAPYDLLFKLSRAHQHYVGVEDRWRDLWTRLAYRALSQQYPDGSWGSGTVVLYSPATSEYVEEKSRRWHEAQKKKNPKYQTFSRNRLWGNLKRWAAIDARLASTCYAMLFLEDGVRPPVIGQLYPAGKSKVATKTTELLRSREHLPVRVLPIESQTLPLGSVVPFLHLRADDRAITNALVKSASHRVLNAGGTVLLEIPSGASAKKLEEMLLALVRKGRIDTVPATASFMEKYPGKDRPKLRAVLRPDDTPAILFLPLTAQKTPTTGLISYAQAVRTLYAVIKDYYARTGTASRQYPSKVEGLKDPFVTRIALLANLRRPQARVVEPAPGSEKPGPGKPAPKEPDPAQPAPEPDAPPLAEDEKW